ncbi:MAG: hypothetical protein N2321_02225 [Melioribacteraceae bacterium]|nr:hypothetical protein [Melioribacteraceae bacterium]
MQIILLVILCTINAIIAKNKGYNPFIWFFAAGLLWIIVISFLPNDAIIVKNKGYNFLFWFFAAGLLGLIVISFLPNTNAEKYNAEESEKLTKRGDNIGLFIIVVSLFIILIFFIASLI